MKKIFTLMAVFWFALVGLAGATNYDYTADVFKRINTNAGGMELVRITSGVTFKVLTINTDTAATITRFADPVSTSVTNPVTTTNFASSAVCKSKVRFRGTASTFDVIVTDTSGGYSSFVEGFSVYDHKIIIDERANMQHHGVIWFGASDNAATDTGVDFLSDTFIHDVWVEVVTVDSTETISVGTEDTAAGFRTGVSVATAGYITDTGVVTAGNTLDYTAASTYGALLATAITGTDGVATGGGRSFIYHVVTTSGTDDDLYYTGSAGSDTAAGYIHYFFTRMR